MEQEKITDSLQKEIRLPSTEQMLTAQKTASATELSFSARIYLQTHSQSLVHAARQVKEYLSEKRVFQQQQKSSLENELSHRLEAHRTLATGYNLDKLEEHTRTGIDQMKQDHALTKATFVEYNQDLVRERQYLSSAAQAYLM